MGSSLNLVPASVSDYRRIAEKKLPRIMFDYLDGGAGAEVTLRNNVADWERLQLEQRVMVDVSSIDTSVDLFGQKLQIPLILSPIGMGGMMARRAEVQAKKAADAAGIPFCLSTVSICPLDEVKDKTGSAPWFQLYMLKDRGVVTEMLTRARDVGVDTLVFTIDLVTVGTRYRDIRNGLSGNISAWGKFRSGPVDYLLHPNWLWNVAMRGRPHVFGNIAAYVPKATRPTDFAAWIAKQFDATVNWNDIAWLRKIWPGRLILKGILNVDDARQAAAAGADGIIVSNHGGRQLDGVASGAVMLPHIADAVGNDTTILVDGGIRSGQDLVKALALGAKAAMIGRPWVYAVAAEGEAGVSHMLNLFRQDMQTALALTAIPNARDVDRSALLHI